MDFNISKKGFHKNSNKSNSYLTIITWIIMISWTIFLIYCVINGSVLKNTVNEEQKWFTYQNIHGSLTQYTDTSDMDHIYVIFSTDCSLYQDWQTHLLFHSAIQVKQNGILTRIASGCDYKKQIELRNHYSILYPNYRIHFTPDYKKDPKTKKNYAFYNKPYGVLHWLENSNPPVRPGAIIALVDPDFIFLRPLTASVAGQSNVIVSGSVRSEDIFDRVTVGRPVAQHYGIGAPWVVDDDPQLNRSRICGIDSPCMQLHDEEQGKRYFSVGAPYILESSDMLRLTQSWVRLVPRVYENYPYLLAEMFAYAMAAAHERLPHLRVDHFMVSNVHVHGEGWPWVDALGDDVCVTPVGGVFFPDSPMPTFVHYCQRYLVENLGFWKRSVDHHVFSCEAPMLIEPSIHLSTPNSTPKLKQVVEVIYAMHPLTVLQGNDQELRYNRRNGFMLCTIHRAFNAALEYYKSKMCHKNANTNKSAIFSDNS